MRYMTFTILGVAGVVTFAPSTFAATKVDVEQARAAARAGGPINAADAEILRRYGCESGSRSSFCENLNHGSTRAYRHGARRTRYPGGY